MENDGLRFVLRGAETQDNDNIRRNPRIMRFPVHFEDDALRRMFEFVTSGEDALKDSFASTGHQLACVGMYVHGIGIMMQIMSHGLQTAGSGFQNFVHHVLQTNDPEVGGGLVRLSSLIKKLGEAVQLFGEGIQIASTGVNDFLAHENTFPRNVEHYRAHSQAPLPMYQPNDPNQPAAQP